jgi:hypothetical protein
MFKSNREMLPRLWMTKSFEYHFENFKTVEQEIKVGFDAEK